MVNEVGCKGGKTGLVGLAIPIKDALLPATKDSCMPIVPDSCGAVIKFGIDVVGSPPPAPSPPNKSAIFEVLGFVIEFVPKRSNSPDVSLGDGGAGIPFPLPKSVWSFLVVLSQDAPPKAELKSAKSPSPALGLLDGVPKPKLPLEAGLLVGGMLKVEKIHIFKNEYLFGQGCT